MSDTTSVFESQARAAREAAHELAPLTRARKDAALHAMADALAAHEAPVLEANRADIARAEDAGISGALIDRLRLTPERIASMVAGLRSLAGLADPVGEVVRGFSTPTGVRITQVRVPLGVVGIIYEARPNVTADAAGICLKSGNAALLRGSSSALHSNRAVIEALRAGLADAGISPDAVQLVEGGHEVTGEMMRARGLVDVLIPRGGAGLIEAVVSGSSVPVIETGTGNCHLFVDASADLDMAEAIMLNAKVQRPSVCNALETLLVHADVAAEFVPRAVAALAASGVTVHADPSVLPFVPAEHSDRVVPAGPGEFDGEYLSLDLAARVVPDLDAAIAHIRAHTTGHSETIVTTDTRSADRFVAAIDAAAVLVNASSRFVDGGEFGFGAEIGISTQKLHARGPMALPEMTTTKYVLVGEGQIRA
ncbi:MAG TPA: glutamate-5-semialdehyde dehydrogenase [Propionibacteriaceae bacterium]|nr:glutamate-5-semialdehyde dehydrogenase [Propionibacteriaceae bacterium]